MTVPLREVLGAVARDIADKLIETGHPIGGARHDNYVVIVARDEAAQVLEDALDEISEDPDDED